MSKTKYCKRLELVIRWHMTEQAVYAGVYATNSFYRQKVSILSPILPLLHKKFLRSWFHHGDMSHWLHPPKPLLSHPLLGQESLTGLPDPTGLCHVSPAWWNHMGQRWQSVPQLLQELPHHTQTGSGDKWLLLNQGLEVCQALSCGQLNSCCKVLHISVIKLFTGNAWVWFSLFIEAEMALPSAKQSCAILVNSNRQLTQVY